LTSFNEFTTLIFLHQGEGRILGIGYRNDVDIKDTILIIKYRNLPLFFQRDPEKEGNKIFS
jgi:hypothetical protein